MVYSPSRPFVNPPRAALGAHQTRWAGGRIYHHPGQRLCPPDFLDLLLPRRPLPFREKPAYRAGGGAHRVQCASHFLGWGGRLDSPTPYHGCNFDTIHHKQPIQVASLVQLINTCINLLYKSLTIVSPWNKS
jgi:hypothetical protein